MPDRRRLVTLHESSRMPVRLFEDFTRRARALGYSPASAIVRLIHRFIARGFDDGQPETQTREHPPPTGARD